MKIYCGASDGKNFNQCVEQTTTDLNNRKDAQHTCYGVAHALARMKEPADKISRESSVPGAEVQIILFNRRTYKERVLPAYKSFLERCDHSSLIELLQECIQELDAKSRLAEELLWDAARITVAEAQRAAARVFGADSRLQVVRVVGRDFDVTIARQSH